MSPAASQNTHFMPASSFFPPHAYLGLPVPVLATRLHGLIHALTLVDLLATRSRKSFTPPQQNDLDGLEDDPEVQPDRSILDIEQVVLQLLQHVVVRAAVWVVHLSPAGDSRPDHMAHVVVAKPLFFFDLIDKFRPLRPRPHKVHIPLQHTPQLGNLIQTPLPQELTHPRDAWIIVGSPGRARIRLRVRPHGAKFVAVKRRPSPAHAFLAIKYSAR